MRLSFESNFCDAIWIDVYRKMHNFYPLNLFIWHLTSWSFIDNWYKITWYSVASAFKFHMCTICSLWINCIHLKIYIGYARQLYNTRYNSMYFSIGIHSFNCRPQLCKQRCGLKHQHQDNAQHALYFPVNIWSFHSVCF